METINIKLKNIEDATNPFNESLLNEELDNYIVNNCKHISSKESIILNVNNFIKKRRTRTIAYFNSSPLSK